MDLGNTALKWATSDDPENPRTFVHCGADSLPEALMHDWLAVKPERMVGCMVSSEHLALSMTKFFNRYKIDWDWLHSERSFEGPVRLINRYENYQQLGSDRWYAAIGATGLWPREAVVVIHMGTATTVDTVVPCEDGQEFLGGRILPGPAMMFDSLIKKTKCRPGGIGVRKDFPASTSDAISTGILEAHLGVIDRAVRAVRSKGFEPKIVFAGGAAPLLAPYIIEEYPQAVLKHNLVLRGLAMCARQC